jgi:hypothetical protein
MTWTWRYEGDDGTITMVGGDSTSESFTSQGDAETWLGETWRDLLDAGWRR